MGAHPPSQSFRVEGQRGESDKFKNREYQRKMAYSWDNRVKYIVRYMYDIDNNGLLDKNDFDCLAVRVTLIEARGEFPAEKFAENQKVMANLWCELAELADFNKDGVVGVDEYRLDCITRSAFADVKEIDDAFAKLCNDADKAAGGIDKARYQELYADFISNPDES